MKTIRSIIIVSILSLIAQSCHKGGPWGIKGKGESVSETKDLSDFDKIDLSLDAEVYYTQDSVYKVEITAQQNILAVLKSEVRNRTLQFDFRRNVWDHKRIKIVVHSPDLEELSVSGSGDITIQNKLNVDDLELSVSGSGSVFLPSVTAKSLKATISGSGDVTVSGGSVTNESFSISGSGDIDTEQVVAETCRIRVSGSGNVSVNVTETLDVSISGSGDVTYKGNPSITSSISGSGRLVRIK